MFISDPKAESELPRIKAEVSSELEITETTDRISKRLCSKALLFENVSGSGSPVLTNALGNEGRTSMAPGTGVSGLLEHLEIKEKVSGRASGLGLWARRSRQLPFTMLIQPGAGTLSLRQD